MTYAVRGVSDIDEWISATDTLLPRIGIFIALRILGDYPQGYIRFETNI